MRYFTYAWPSGILTRVKETGEEVNLYIFNSSANWSEDALYNQGEYNIFRLPRMEDFDGIILDVNNIADLSVRDQLIESVVRSAVPAVVIGNYFSGLHSVSVDNYGATQEIMQHLSVHHGCKSYWFVMGPENNYENQCRERSVRDFLKQNDLQDAQFYFGDFSCDCGNRGFLELYHRNGNILPQAVVCANDNIAVGVLAEAEKYGLSAPGDFLITGFDDLDKSRYYSPRISTVSYVREELGYVAMDMLLKVWKGEPVPEKEYTPAKTIFWDSCGCESDIQIDLTRHLKDEILYGIETENFEKQLLQLKYSLTHCDSVKEMLQCISRCMPSLRCDELYLVMDQKLHFSAGAFPVANPADYLGLDHNFMENGYPETMQMEFSYVKNRKEQTLKQNVGNWLFPLFDSQQSGVDFLFLPIHFRQKCIGYFAIRNAVYLMEKQFLFDIINALTTALENLYSKERLRDFNQVLSALYNHDSMTMLYNRQDLEKLGNGFVEDLGTDETGCMVYFDLDHLKGINDRYGHHQGDFAIHSVARALEKSFPKESLLFRLGGDEFLVLCKGTDKQELLGWIQNVNRKLQDIRQKNHCPYELETSMGYVWIEADHKNTFDEYTQQADRLMYENKFQKRNGR